jgi:hypothetical protein
MLKRKYNELEEEQFNISSINDVKTKLDKNKKRLIDISREMIGINMQIKCLESQLKKLCNHDWCKVKEETGIFNRPPLKCFKCGLIKAVAQA